MFVELDAAGIVVVIDCGGCCGDFSDDFNLIFNRSSALNGLGLLYDTAAGANDGAGCANGCATDGTGCIVLLIEDLSDEEDDDDDEDEDGGFDVMSLFCKRDCSSLDNASTFS